MNRQSGSQAPIPVTPRDASPSQQPLLQFTAFSAASPPPNTKRKSREGRASRLFAARNRVPPNPIWRPSTGGLTPPTPQWPLPRVPLESNPNRNSNPFFTGTYTQPRDAPLPPPRSSRRSIRSRSDSDTSTTTLSNNERALNSPGGPVKEEQSASQPVAHPLSPRAPPCPARQVQPRGHQQRNEGSFQTRYMNMSLGVHRIPRSHNILSNLFAWMILVAFVVAPANFCSPSTDNDDDDKPESTISPVSTHGSFADVPSAPLLGVSLALFGAGALGMLYLALCWRLNYIWLLNRVYLPLMLNSLAGLAASLVMLKLQHDMWWSASSCVTVALEAGTLLGAAGGFAIIDYLLLGRLKREHRRDTSRNKVIDLVKAGKQPPFAPGSVV